MSFFVSKILSGWVLEWGLPVIYRRNCPLHFLMKVEAMLSKLSADNSSYHYQDQPGIFQFLSVILSGGGCFIISTRSGHKNAGGGVKSSKIRNAGDGVSGL